MFYSFNVDRIIRRFVPRWFRSGQTNMALARVAVGGVRRLQGELQPVREELAAEYRYNGLLHSLEALLNDRFDAALRRIYITVPDQVASLYYEDIEEPSVASYDDIEELSAYAQHNMMEGGNYAYEFIVWIPSPVVFTTGEVFALLDLYRYAGRRPVLRVYNPYETGSEDHEQPAAG